MEKQFSYRIVKISGKAVAIALTAFGLLAGAAQAADINLGTALGQIAPDDGTTRTGARYNAGDFWDLGYNSTASYGASTSRAGDIFYGTTVTYSDTNGNAYNVYPWGTNPVTGGIGYLNDSYPWVAIDAQRTGIFVANTFGNIQDGTQANNYFFGSGTTISDYSRGSKAYANGSFWTAGNNNDGYWSIAVSSGAAAGSIASSAINIAGAATFDGDNRVDGSIVSSGVYIRGSNVNFNGSITAPVYFSSAGSATINGGADLNGSLNFQGFDAKLTLSHDSEISGIVTTGGLNGALKFEGSSRVGGNIGLANAGLKQMDLDGNATRTVTLEGMSYVNLVNINAAGNLIIGNGQAGDGLNTTGVVGGRVDFNNTAGTVTLTNLGTITGQIVSTGGSNSAGNIAVANAVNFNQNGTMTGNIGNSASNRIGTVNVGSFSAGTVNMTGDLYAVALNVSSGSALNITGTVTAATTLSTTIEVDSTLSVTSGDVMGAVTTANSGQGTLTMTGGSGATANTQVVTGDVGTTSTVALNRVNSGVSGSTTLFKGDVTAVTVTNNNGTGTTTFERDVMAININVNNGTSNFTDDVTAMTTTIGSGVGNFNTNGTGTTQSSLVFTGNGTANLNTGLVGDIDFASLNAVVNVSSAQTITGSVTSSGATAKDGSNGVLNFLGSGEITGNIGTDVNTGVSQVNVNTTDDLGSTVILGGHTYAESINLHRNAQLVVAAGKNIVGTTATALTGAQQTITTDADNTGTLTFAGGVQSVTGVVGADGTAIGQINAGVTGAMTTFNNMVFVDQLVYSGNGTVVLNGQNGTTGMASADGIKGLVDFAGDTGVLAIGDGVNLTTGQGALAMANASGATMTFVGDSLVTGVVGGDTANRSTLSTIRAGSTGKKVTFADDVNLINAMVVSGNGQVDFAHGKSLMVSTGPAAVAQTAGNGTVNFQGSTNLAADLGVSGTNLSAVNFNTATNNAVQYIARNVYANTVTIGSAAGTTDTSQVAITGGFDFAGANRMFAYNGGTTANIANVGATGTIALGDHLVIANDKTAVNFGVAHVTTGAMTTRGGAMSFTVDSTDITTGSSLSASAGSAQIVTSGALNMLGTEKVHINYVGSLAQNGSYALIQSTAGTQVDLGNDRDSAPKVTDNSFAIDSSVSQATNGSLILTADRSAGGSYAANQAYIQKAGVVGHYSNNAAMVLGGIAAAGTQTADMVEVIQKIEIDSFGFGDSADHLATQVKRLAPVANASVTKSTMAASGLAMNAVSGRMATLRGDSTMASGQQASGLAAGDAAANKGFWIKGLGATNKQDKQGVYDGYSTNISGVTVGIDNRVNAQLVLGGALGLTKANIKQADFRLGDTNSVDSKQLMGYGTYNFSNELFMDGALSYASNDYTGVRTTAVGRTAKSDFNGAQLGASLGLGYGFDLGNKSKVTPMALIDYSSLTQDAYTETGAGAINLAVGKQTAKNTRVGLGARLTHEWSDGDTTFRPEVALNWYRNTNVNNDVTASFVGGGSAFVTPGTTSVGRNTMGLGLGMTIVSGKASSIQIRYDLDKTTGFKSNAGSLLARWEY